MNKALKKITIPFLKAKGFKGSLPHFRRLQEDCYDLMTFQFDKYGGGFVIEMAQCAITGIVTSWGEKIPPEKAKAYQVSNRRDDVNPKYENARLRPQKDKDYWFRYDYFVETEAYSKLAEQVNSMINLHAENWFRRKR